MSHYIDPELIEGYATGRLEAGWSLLVAAHLELCPEARATAAAYEAVGGAMLDTIDPVDVAPTCCDAVLKRVGAVGAKKSDAIAAVTADRAHAGNPLPDDAPILAPEVTGSRPAKDVAPHHRARASSIALSPVLPTALRDAFGGELHELSWKRVSADVSQIVLEREEDGISCRLLRVRAGRPVATHSHRGRELTLVLAGSFSDQFGRFERGDVEMSDETVEHQPVAGEGEDCICFAVTDAPLRFRNPLVALLQPLFRI
ncbi:MAG: ChrR family anti-sigma-E factor [Pseudomonadota bacterium]